MAPVGSHGDILGSRGGPVGSTRTREHSPCRPICIKRHWGSDDIDSIRNRIGNPDSRCSDGIDFIRFWSEAKE